MWFSWFWSHFFFSILCFCTFENVKKCVLGGCTITSKTKINVFWNIFFTPLAPFGQLYSKIFYKMLILALEANSALSWENETKIEKITHSVLLLAPWSLDITFEELTWNRSFIIITIVHTFFKNVLNCSSQAILWQKEFEDWMK